MLTQLRGFARQLRQLQQVLASVAFLTIFVGNGWRRHHGVVEVDSALRRHALALFLVVIHAVNIYDSFVALLAWNQRVTVLVSELYLVLAIYTLQNSFLLDRSTWLKRHRGDEGLVLKVYAGWRIGEVPLFWNYFVLAIEATSSHQVVFNRCTLTELFELALVVALLFRYALAYALLLG